MTLRTALGPGGEFDLIRRFLGDAGRTAADPRAPAGSAGGASAVRVGPGDDCAILDAGAPLAVTTDMSVEGVHFRRDWLTPEEIGWRAAASALSDLAAMAAEPVAAFVSVALTPDDVASGWALRLMDGVREALAHAGAELAGGDVTRSTGPVAIDVVATGRAPAPVLRSGARPGDEIWVTGALGGAGAAVRRLAAGVAVGEALSAAARSAALPDPLRDAFAHPLPRIREALWLRERATLHALIDLSDGLAGDLGHVAAASGVRIDVELAAVPAADGATLDDALHAGEDYELAIAAPPGSLGAVAEAFRERHGIPLTRVGTVRDGDGVWGDGRRLERGGFDHFGATARGRP